MKKSILKGVVILVGVCFLLNLTSPLLKNTSLAWISLDSLSFSDNFYFRKGQWLADGRTVMAAIRFLYQTRESDDPMKVVNLPVLPGDQPELSTNVFAVDEAEPTVLLQKRGFSRAENLIIRERQLSSYGPSPLFANANSSMSTQDNLPSLNWQIIVRHGPIGTKPTRVAALPTNIVLPRPVIGPPSA